MSKKIFFTGGGTAGHVTPNLALIDYFKSQDWAVGYIGTAHGIEKTLVNHIPYFNIASGKLRRYFSWQNFIDPFKVLWAVIQSLKILCSEHPDVLFSKGGFVALPVVIAAWLCRIPVIIHESDFSPGLANKLSFPFASKICTTFKTTNYPDKTVITGNPIRPELLQGDRVRGLICCGFSDNKPILLFMGGSSGSALINQVLRESLDKLLLDYQIIHCCGRNNINNNYNQSGYYQIAYADKELPDLYACADVIISRAGANTVYEVLGLQKPHLFIPLSKKYSRGDQLENAEYFRKQGVSQVLLEEALTPDNLINAINKLFSDRHKFQPYQVSPGLTQVCAEINSILAQ